MTPSPQIVKIIANDEGCVLRAYQNPGDVPTIGYGHTHGVKLGDTCTLDQAEKWLMEDAMSAAQLVNAHRFALNQNQFDALVCFVYNVGHLGLAMAEHLQNGQYELAANQIPLFVHDSRGKVLPGLVKRRQQEKALFETPVSHA